MAHTKNKVDKAYLGKKIYEGNLIKTRSADKQKNKINSFHFLSFFSLKNSVVSCLAITTSTLFYLFI